jgi:hypothetical protein
MTLRRMGRTPSVNITFSGSTGVNGSIPLVLAQRVRYAARVTAGLARALLRRLGQCLDGFSACFSRRPQRDAASGAETAAA